MAVSVKYKELFEFCSTGDRVGLSNYVLTNGCNPNAYDTRDDHGQTAVHIACQHGHLFIVRSLIEVFGCDPTIKDYNQNLPIHIACLHGHLPVVDYLLNLIDDENISNAILSQDVDGNTLLHKACQSGSVATVRYLQHALCCPENRTYKKLSLYDDSIVVYNAADGEKSHIYKVRLLVQSIMKQNQLGDTALHVACRHGHVDVLRLFQVYFPFNDLLESLFVLAIKGNHIHIANYLRIARMDKMVNFDSEVYESNFNVATPQNFEIIGLVRYRQLGPPRSIIWQSNGKTIAKCKHCNFRMNISVIPGFDRKSLIGSCPKCNKFKCDDNESKYKFKCKNCHSVFSSTKIVNIKCAKCRQSNKICLIVNQITSSHHVLIRHPRESPTKAAALCGNLELYQQTQLVFPSGDGSILHSACVSDNLDLVKHIMKASNIGTDKLDKELDKEKNTPLHIACEWGSKNIFSFLSSGPFQSTKLNKYNQTPFSLACKYSRKDMCTDLLKCGLEIEKETDALHWACGNGDLDLVKQIVNHCSSEALLEHTDVYGDTVLFDACRSRNLDMVNFLVMKGSDPLHINSKTKETPVHIVCRMGESRILDALCQSPRIKSTQLKGNVFGITPIHLLVEKKFFEMIETLIKFCSLDLNQILNENNSTLLHCAIKLNQVRLIQCFLRCPSVNWNAQDCDGNTALHLACIQNDTEIVKLLARVSSIFKKNIKELTPLHIIVSKRNFSLLATLLDEFTNSLDECIDGQGNTVLHTACEMLCNDSDLNVTSIIFLLSKFCSVISPNKLNQTPLHLACGSNNLKTIEHLLGKLPETTELEKVLNGDKDSLLHVAVRNSSIEVIALLSTYISSTCKSEHGETPIHIACEKRDIKVVQMLTAKSSKVVYLTNGDSYLHSACRQKSPQAQIIASYLLNNFDQKSLLAANEEGNTPLHEACLLGATNIILQLLQHSQSIFLSLNKENLTPFCCLLVNNYEGVFMDLLAKHKVEPDIWCSDAKPMIHCVLHFATSYARKLKLIHFLVSKKYCDPLKCDEYGNTILHCFVSNIHVNRMNHMYDFSSRFVSNINQTNHVHHFSSLRLWDFLLRIPDIDVNKQNSYGDTLLHILCKIHKISAYQNEDVIIKELLTIAETKITESINTKNNQGKTPVQLANMQIMTLLFAYGANPNDVYMEFYPVLEKFKSEHPLKPSQKIIVVGNSAAGKSTLVDALKQLESKPSNISVVTQRIPTAGMRIIDHDSKELGRVTFHDFAGQPEYESSISAFLENSVSDDQPPIFLLLVDASNNTTTIDKQTQYWFTFIQNHSPHQLQTPPHVIILGSYVDRIHQTKYKEIEICIKTAIASVHSSNFHVLGPFLLDCRQVDTNLQKLNMIVAKSCSSLRKTVDVDIRCHILFAFLSKWFDKKAAVKFCDIQDRIKSTPKLTTVTTPARRYRYPRSYDHEKFLLPFTKEALLELLRSLHAGGHVLLLNAEHTEDCWIVMDNNSLFEKVNGTLFAPESFKKPRLATNTGVVSKKMLQEHFDSVDTDLISAFTIYSEFCQRIEDSETLMLIQNSCSSSVASESMPQTGEKDVLATYNDSEGATMGDVNASCFTDSTIAATQVVDSVKTLTLKEQFFFFPGLVKCERPTDVWEDTHHHSKEQTYGWCLMCNRKNFLEPRFLDVLNLRLTFSFAASKVPGWQSFERKCIIWKNGIRWSTTSGVQVLVEVVEQNTAVILLIRYYKGFEMEGVKLRSQIIKKILETKEQFCPKAKMTEYLLIDCLTYPKDLDCQLKIPINEVAQSIVDENGDFVIDSNNKPHLLKEILFFDPYLGVNGNLIEDLWSEESAEQDVPAHFLYELAEAHHTFINQIVKLLGIPQREVFPLKQKWQDEPIKLLFHIYESWKARQEKPYFESLRNLFSCHSIFCDRNPLEVLKHIPQEDSILLNEATCKESNMCTLELESGQAYLDLAFKEAQLQELRETSINLENVSIEHLMSIVWQSEEEGNSVVCRLHIAQDASTSWEVIAELLQVDPDQFNPGPPKPPQDCTVDLLKWWLENDTEYDRTWAGLYSLLHDSNLTSLAEKLKEAISSSSNSVLRYSHPITKRTITAKHLVSQQQKKKAGASKF